MSHWRYASVLWLALPLGATTIDVALQHSVLLRAGDELEFTFSSWSYLAHAGTAPQQLAFTLASAPFDVGSEFTASLESRDGALSAEFGDVSVSTAYFQSALYRGMASSIRGSIAISAEIAGIFSWPAAVLVLRNAGADVTLGLPPYTLSQDMMISLSGKGLNVGGVVGGVVQEQAADPLLSRDVMSGLQADDSGFAVPEPATGGLLLAGATLACLVTCRNARRGLRPSKESKAGRK